MTNKIQLNQTLHNNASSELDDSVMLMLQVVDADLWEAVRFRYAF